LFATWLLFDTGRSERRRRAIAEARSLDQLVEELPSRSNGGGGVSGELASAVAYRDAGRAVSLALANDRSTVSAALADAALADRAGSFIVMAHLIKTSEAAGREAAATGSPLPLAATARFLASPRLERFVARNVTESIDFVRSGRPPRR
jgi:hypothetical protein